MAKVTGFEDILKKFKNCSKKLTDEEYKNFETIADDIGNYPFDFFEEKSNEDLCITFGFKFSNNLKKCCSVYRLALAFIEYVQWEDASKRN